MAAKIKIEGLADLGINTFQCVCGHCGHTDKEKAIIEINFMEQKILYLCGKCKKENFMVFGKEKPAPYPRTRLGR
jgi:hypothetical protein